MLYSRETSHRIPKNQKKHVNKAVKNYYLYELQIIIFIIVVSISFSMLDVLIPESYVLIFLSIALAIMLPIKIWLSRKGAEKVRQEALREHLDNLQKIKEINQWLNYHFVGNSLNLLRAYYEIYPQQKFLQLLEELTELIQQSFVYTQEIFLPLKNELDFLKKYIYLLEKVIDTKINIDIKIQEKHLLNAEIPVSLLQPLVENSIKYGKTKEIKIDISQRNKYIYIKIQNPCSHCDKIQEGRSLTLIRKYFNYLSETSDEEFTFEYHTENNSFITLIKVPFIEY